MKKRTKMIKLGRGWTKCPTCETEIMELDIRVPKGKMKSKRKK